MGAQVSSASGESTTLAPLSNSSIKPTETDIESLRELVHAANVHFHAHHIRAAEAEVTQASIQQLNGFSKTVEEAIATSWDNTVKSADKSNSSLQSEQLAVVSNALPLIFDKTFSLFNTLLTIVVDSEVGLLNAASSQAGLKPNAKRALHINKAKLHMQMQADRASKLIIEGLEGFREKVLADLPRLIDLMMKPLHRMLDETLTRPKGSTVVPRAAFIEHTVSSVLLLLDASKVTESAEFLRTVQGSEVLQAGEDDVEAQERVSARVELHSARLIATAEKQAAEKTVAASVQEAHAKSEEQYRALTAETPGNLRSVFEAKERQLSQLVTEVHKFGCTPPMHVTLTNAAGNFILELDVPGGKPFEFRDVRIESGEIRNGLYCRVSPAVTMLMVHSVQRANKVIEHSGETEVLAKDDAGWKNLTTGVIYTTTIPSGQ